MPTALELSKEELMEYVAAWRGRTWPALTAEQVAARNALIARAKEAARMLKEKYGATRVVLFGSLAHQAWFHEDSDVDIAAEGMNDYWKAWGDVEKYFPGKQVDLIDWDMATESLRKAINRKGVDL